MESVQLEHDNMIELVYLPYQVSIQRRVLFDLALEFAPESNCTQ